MVGWAGGIQTRDCRHSSICLEAYEAHKAGKADSDKAVATAAWRPRLQ